MERRQFLKIAGIGTAAGLISGNMFNMSNLNKSNDLLYHKIADIKFTNVKLNYPRLVGKNSQLDVHGWGPTSGIHIF